ncbi:MAG: hypothetical protein HY825_00560 [Acidobacteria bacterium]|nr:hypothetical protein [Acidobacteriota bacterium]
MLWPTIGKALSPLLGLLERSRREQVLRDQTRERRIGRFVGDFLARRGSGLADALRSGVRRLGSDAEIREAFERIEVATGQHPLLPAVAALFEPDDDLASFFRSLTPEDERKARSPAGLQEVVAQWRLKRQGFSRRRRSR